MENSLEDKKPKERREKQAVDDLSILLDSIDTEINDLTDFSLPDESLLNDMDLGAEEELTELDPELLEEDSSVLEMDSESGKDLIGPAAEIEPADEGSENELSTSVDNQAEEEIMLAEAANTPEVATSTPVDDSTAKVEVVEKTATVDKPPSESPSTGYELEPEVEGKRDTDRQKSDSDNTIDELAALMNKKMEETLGRLVEEKMPDIVERIILRTIKKILLSME